MENCGKVRTGGVNEIWMKRKKKKWWMKQKERKFLEIDIYLLRVRVNVKENVRWERNKL